MRQSPTGYILYEGPSLLNGVPIVAIVTGAQRPSENIKTGPMLQCYILVADMHPAEATCQGHDAAICGECDGRMCRKGWCYVTIGHGVRQVWEQLRRGAYSPVSLVRKASRIFRGRHVRIGAYGDPLAVPLRIRRAVANAASAHTGYTHQWITQPKSHHYRGLVMASCDNAAQAQEAVSQGWSTFRHVKPGEQLLPIEKRCAYESSGLQCIQCGLCNGTTDGQRSVATTVHGARAKRF